MKRSFDSKTLSVLAVVLGAAAQLLRRLYLLAADEKGLLLRGHPLSIALLALTAATALLVVFSVRKQETPEISENSRFYGFLGALGHVAMAAGILLTALTGFPRVVGYLGTAWQLLGYGAPLCLLITGVASMLGKKSFFLLYVVPCLFFVTHIVCHYQTWSGNPQMQDYVFALLGAMALMFFSFYTAAREAGCGSPRMRLGMGLAALYLCLAELANTGYPVLYLGGVLWVLTDLWNEKTVPAAEKE